ncbi:MAG: response regulator [Myxococcaceae bacterium]
MKRAPPPALPSTVLIVDDEELVIDVLARLLDKRNLPHQGVTTGEEAIRLLGEQRFGCVLTDKNLPGVDGLEVIRTARRLQPFCACILMTGYSSTASALEALRLGAADYLEKPFPEVGLVVQKIESAIRHQRVAFERNTLVAAIRGMQDQLRKKDEQAFAQHTELEMLESVLDLKVSDATIELRERVEKLEAVARADKELEGTLQQGLDELLAYVRGIKLESDDAIDVARGVLREVARRAESCAALLGDDDERG